MSRRIINVAVLAISLTMLTGVTCAPVQTTLTPEQVCSAISNCQGFSSIPEQQTGLFQTLCPIGLKMVQDRDATCYACVAQNPCDVATCLDSCSTLINSFTPIASLFSSLEGQSAYQATEASDPSGGDVLPAP